MRVPPSVAFDARADVERGARRISISWRRPQHAGAPYTLTRTLFAAVAPPRRGDAAARIVLAPDGSYAVLLITLRKAEAGVTRAWPALSADDAGAAGSAAAAPNARGAKFFPGDRVTARAGWIRISMDNPSDGVDVEAGSAATGRAAGSALRSDCAWICPYGTAHGSGYSPDDTDVAAEAPLRKAGSAPALGRLFLRQFLKVTAASQLLTAVKCGDSDVVRTLLVRDGIDVSVAEADTGLTPIMAACQAHLRQSGEAYGADAFTLRQLDATLRLLLEHANAAAQRGAHGGDGGDCDDGGYAARHVRRTRLRSVIDAQDGSGNSALHYACWAGRLVAIQLLLDPPGWGDDIAGASLFSRDLFGRTPMHAACWQGHDLVACMLLRRACALPVENVMADFSMDAFSGEAAPSAAQPGVETRRACDYVDTVRFVANDDAASGEAHGSESAAAAAAAAPRTWLDGSPNRDGEPLTEQTVRIDVSNLRSTEDAIRALLDARATAFAFPIHMAGMLAGPTPIDYMILNNHEVPTGTAAFVLSYKNPGFKSRALRRLHSNPRWRPIIATPETANDALLDWARHLSLRGFACSRDEYDEHGGVAGRTQRYGRSKGTVPPMKTAATIRALLKEDLPFAAAWAKINGARGSAAIESAASGAQGDGGWLAATARQHGIGMEEGGIDVQKVNLFFIQFSFVCFYSFKKNLTKNLCLFVRLFFFFLAKLWLSHFAELDATMGASEAADDRVQIFTIAKETDSARLHRTWWRRPDEVRAHDDGARAGSFAPLRVVSAPGWARDATAAAAAAGAAQRAGASPPRCLAYAPHAPSGRSPDETHEPGMFFVVNGAPGTDAEKYGYRGESRMYTFGLYPCVARRFRQIMRCVTLRVCFACTPLLLSRPLASARRVRACPRCCGATERAQLTAPTIESTDRIALRTANDTSSASCRRHSARIRTTIRANERPV